MLRCIFVVFILLCLFLAALAQTDALGQDIAPSSWNELAQRMAAERVKVVSYKVFVSVRNETFTGPDLTTTSGPSEMEYYFEFSRRESHFVCAKRAKTESAQRDWYVVGRSDGVKFVGSNKKLGVSDQINVKPIYFDPLVTGLHFCEMFVKYSSYEDSLLDLSRNDPLGNVVRGVGAYVVWTCPGDGVKMIVDPKQGYWPISYEAHHVYKSDVLKRNGQDVIDNSLRQVLTKVKDHYLPLTTNMSCFNDTKIGKKVVEMSFDWKLVNEPIATGEQAPKSVAESLGMNVVEIHIPTTTK